MNLSASLVPYQSTYIEWSITNSTGTYGFIKFIFLESTFATSSLKLAKSTTAGTPVRSYNNTLDG